MGAVRTQGTELFIFDEEGNVVLKVDCPTTATGFSGGRSQIDVSCLEDIADQFEAGRIQPGTVTLGLNVDPQSASHLRLHELYAEGTKFDFALGWGDFTPGPPAAGPVPTLDSNGLVLPSTRSWLQGNAYVSDFSFDFNPNDVVKSSLTLQLSGFVSLIPKA